MDSDTMVVESDLKKSSFIEHLFNFDDDSKNEMLNILQYMVLAFIPVILLNKGVSKIIPPVDEANSSWVLSAEILGQASLIFLGMLLIHRFVTYFPTYSKIPYARLHVTNTIIVFLVIVASFQTRIGEKTNILIDRFFDLIEGRTSLGEQNKQESKQPSSQQQMQQSQQLQQMPQHMPSRADMTHSGTTSISQLQINEAGQGSNSAPDFNSMFSGPTNPMVNAQTPGSSLSMNQGTFQEPMAANEFGPGLNAY
jgi:hypothetical protein